MAEGQRFSVRLEQPPKFSGEMDKDVVDSWVFQVENYFALSGMVDENIKARYSTMLLDKSAAIWLRNKNYNLTTLQWTNLKQDIKSYFQPADFHRRARDKLATCVQSGTVSKYIDAMKRHGQRIAGITDDEMLDRFIRGLKPAIQRKILKDNPQTFTDACQIAECIGRLDTYLSFQYSGVSDLGNHDPMDIDNVEVNVARSNNSRKQRDYTTQQDSTRYSCWFCGKRGHMQKDCIAKRKEQNSYAHNNNSFYRGKGQKYRKSRGNANQASTSNNKQNDDESKN